MNPQKTNSRCFNAVHPCLLPLIWIRIHTANAPIPLVNESLNYKKVALFYYKGFYGIQIRIHENSENLGFLNHLMNEIRLFSSRRRRGAGARDTELLVVGPFVCVPIRESCL